MSVNCGCPYKGRVHRHYAFCEFAAKNRPFHSKPRFVYEEGTNTGIYRCGVARCRGRVEHFAIGGWQHV